jgi:ion channel-forming bestrophin family protein
MIVAERTGWIRLLFTVYGSTLPRIWPRLLGLAIVAEGVVLLKEHSGLFHSALSVQPFSIMGIALGIFLGFRNNTCYDRWWEGRILWGQVTNNTRNLSRMILAFNRGESGPDERGAVQIRALVAWVHALRQRLRRQPRPEELEHLLPKDVLDSLVHSTNPPMRILSFVSDALREDYDTGRFAPNHHVAMEEMITQLINHQGGCERILSTPIPISYSVLLHRLVALYCFGLPFALVGSLGHVTTIVSVAIAYAFIGIDAVGVELEDPFGEDPNDLPLLAISQTIEANLRELIGESHRALPAPDARGQLL